METSSTQNNPSKKNIIIEHNNLTHNLTLDHKISDLLEFLTSSSEISDSDNNNNNNNNKTEKFIMEINIQNGIKIKSAPRDEFLSGKTQLEDLIHPYFENKSNKSNKKEKNPSESEIKNKNPPENSLENLTNNEKKSQLEFLKSDKIMVFSPHPDDEILGACGLLYKCFNENLNIKVVYMTSGKGGGNADQRKNEAISGIKKLGGNEESLIFSNLPFYNKKDRKVTEEDYNYVMEILKEHRPNKVFICADIFDPNGTHRKCFDVLMEIYEKKAFNDIKFFFYYSVWYWPKENEYSHLLNYEFDTYRVKVYAMLEHKSQLTNGFMGEDPRPFYQRACARDNFYGMQYGKAYSEVYYLLNED